MIKYLINPGVQPEEIAVLRESVAWNGMKDYYDKALANSYFHICCYDGSELVGFIDVVSNRSTDAYLQDLMVKPQYQGRGIGTKLVNLAIEKLKQDKIFMISVLFDEKLLTFYKKFGFHILLAGQLETYLIE